MHNEYGGLFFELVWFEVKGLGEVDLLQRLMRAGAGAGGGVHAPKFFRAISLVPTLLQNLRI